MKIFKYWDLVGTPIKEESKYADVICYGGSNISQEDALRKATERSQHIAAKLRRGEPVDDYDYSEKHLREEIKDEIFHGDKIIGLITRNRGGALVLNSENTFFADIDYQPSPKPGLLELYQTSSSFKDFFAKLFGEKSDNPQDQDDEIVSRVRQVVDTTPNLGARLYRTAKGFRCMVTSRTYDPTSAESYDLLEKLESDPLYTKLCKAQECFRARVSPKFWRCGAITPSARYPFMDEEIERSYRDWESTYQRCADKYATCAYIGSFGNPTIHPAIELTMLIHDKMACKKDLPLA